VNEIDEAVRKKIKLDFLLKAIEVRLEHCQSNGCNFRPLTHGTWPGEVRCDSCYREPPPPPGRR